MTASTGRSGVTSGWCPEPSMFCFRFAHLFYALPTTPVQAPRSNFELASQLQKCPASIAPDPAPGCGSWRR